MRAADFPSWLEERALEKREADRFRFAEVAGRMADRLRALQGGELQSRRARACQIVSIEGPGGTGKTSLLNLIMEELLAGYSVVERPLEIRYSQRLSAADGVPCWQALAERIGEAFYGRLHDGVRQGDEVANAFYIADPLAVRRMGNGRPKEIPKIKIDEIYELSEPRLYWREVAQRLAIHVPNESWDPCLKLFCDAPSKVPARALSMRERLGFLVTGIVGGAKGWLGNPGDAIASGEAVLRQFAGPGILEGPSWGVNSLEFVGALDRLITVLHPKGGGWRAIVAIDDTSMMSGDQVDELLIALDFLGRLSEVLVIVVADELLLRRLGSAAGTFSADAEDVQSEERSDGREGLSSHLFSLRLRVPRIYEADFPRMVVDLLGDRDDGAPFSLASDIIRKAFAGRAVTPRQIKAALRWLWMRSAVVQMGSAVDELISEGRAGEREGESLCLLLDVFFWQEMLADADSMYVKLRANAALLLSWDVQPWDFRDWLDGYGAGAHLANVPPEMLWLLVALRMQEAIAALGLGRGALAEGRDNGRRVFEEWRERVTEDDVMELARLDQLLSAVDLAQALAQTVARKDGALAALWLNSQVTSAARHAGFVVETEELSTGLDAIRRWQFDSDALIRLATASKLDVGIGPEERARAWVMLFFVDPRLAVRYAALLERDQAAAACIPEVVLGMRDRLAAMQDKLSPPVQAGNSSEAVSS